jgi:hypothetical protein
MSFDLSIAYLEIYPMDAASERIIFDVAILPKPFSTSLCRDSGDDKLPFPLY